MTACIVVTGGPTARLLPVLALPIAFTGARFRDQVVLAGVALGVVAITALAFAMDPRAVIDNPATGVGSDPDRRGSAALTVAIQEQRSSTARNP